MDRDFDFGNIIYLIATIVAVIIGILGKKKKPSSAQGQEEAVYVDMEDQEQELIPEVSEFQKEGERPAPKGNLMIQYEKLLAEKGRSLGTDFLLDGRIDTEEALEVIQLDEEEGADYFDIIDNFDAGKAVIYAAIINRVDY